MVFGIYKYKEFCFGCARSVLAKACMVLMCQFVCKLLMCLFVQHDSRCRGLFLMFIQSLCENNDSCGS